MSSLSSSTRIFLGSQKVVFSTRNLQVKQSGNDGEYYGEQGRVERVQEMRETVETVLGMGDGIHGYTLPFTLM